MACSCSINEWCNRELEEAATESATFGIISAQEFILKEKIHKVMNRVRTELCEIADECDVLIQSPDSEISVKAKEKLDFRIKPCLAVFAIMETSTAKEILYEIKEVLSDDRRPSCGLDSCTCHLRRLTAFLADWRDDRLIKLEEHIVAAEDRRHAARDATKACEEALDSARLQYQVAVDAQTYYEYQNKGQFRELPKWGELQEARAHWRQVVELAEDKHDKAVIERIMATEKFYETFEMRKGKIQELWD